MERMQQKQGTESHSHILKNSSFSDGNNISQSDGSSIVTSHGDSCSYSTFVRSTDESECTMVRDRNFNESIPYQPGPTPLFSAKDVAMSILKKRKRHISISDNENTPKRSNFLFRPVYSGNDKVMSPIAVSEGGDDFLRSDFASSPLETPNLSLKISNKVDTQNIVSSTPIIHSEKDKLKAKKSILRFDRIKTDASDSDSSCDFSGLSPCSSEVDNVEELLSEITAICEEGLKDCDNEKLRNSADDTDKVSRIDIEELIGDIETFIEDVSNEFELTVVDTSGYNVEETVLCTGDQIVKEKREDSDDVVGEDIVKQGTCKGDTEGTSAVVIDVIVGDETTDKTLTPENAANGVCSVDNSSLQENAKHTEDNVQDTIESSSALKTVNEVKENRVIKVKEDRNPICDDITKEVKCEKVVSEIKNKEQVASVTNVIPSEKLTVGRFKGLEATVNGTVIEISSDSDNDDVETRDILGLDEYTVDLANLTVKDIQTIVGELPEELKEEKFQEHLKDTGSREVKIAETVSNVKKGKKLNEEKRSDIKLTKGAVIGDLDQTLFEWNEDSELIRKAKKRWKWKTVPDAETNLTIARTHKNKNGSSLGRLEGNKVCCLELYEHLWDDSVSSTHSRGRQDQNRPLSIKQTLNRLHAQLRLLDTMRYNTLRELRLQMDRDIDMIKDRHRLELQKLHHRQNREVRDLGRHHGRMPAVRQASRLQLRQDHEHQLSRMKAHHQAVYKHLCQVWKHKLDIAENSYATRSNMLFDQIQQVEAVAKCSANKNGAGNSDASKNDRNGPAVLVTLRKAPSSDTQYEHSTVSVRLAAQVAQAVSLEDDIYDHFYAYD